MLNAKLKANGEALPLAEMSQDMIDALGDLTMRMYIATRLVDDLLDNVAAIRDIFSLADQLGAEEVSYQVYELSGAVKRIKELLTEH